MRVGVALLALVVVLAGCAAPFTAERHATETPAATPASADATPASTTVPASTPTATPTSAATPTATSTPRPPSPTPRTDGKVTVEGLPAGVDEEAVYRDVVAMHGREYESAPNVELRVKPEADDARTSQVWETTEFMQLWGFDPSRMNSTSIAGLAVGNRVFLYVETVPTDRGRRSVLAHEYTHVLQHDEDAFQRTMAGIREGGGNERRVYLAVIEGSAAYAQERYVERHMNGTPADQTWAMASANRSRFGTYVIAPYHFGPRYVRERVDSVANLSSVYDDPPRTTEQVIHGYGPDEEPAKPLDVHGSEGGDAAWYYENREVRGELFVRLVLEGQLDNERAARAAAGWGADRVMTFRESLNTTKAHAWVLRWDSPDEADEFDAAMRDYLDARGDRTDGRWTDGGTAFDLRRVGDETVVVLAGPDRFVDRATVGGTAGNVSVEAGEE